MREMKKETFNYIVMSLKNELTEQQIYLKLAKKMKNKANEEILLKIAEEEGKHAQIWKGITGKTNVKPNKIKIFFILLMAKFLGITFSLKLMEKGENKAKKKYLNIAKDVPEVVQISADEEKHENELLSLLDEEKLKYVGSMVLGLSDALVEISGTLAGLTFALKDTRLTALSGLITGVSATLSMASSEYLSSKAEGKLKSGKSAIYTGIAYLITVVLMILPYLILPNDKYLFALIWMLSTVILVILVFTFYISVAKEVPFKKRFLEMAIISLTVSGVSFGIGLLVKEILGVSI